MNVSVLAEFEPRIAAGERAVRAQTAVFHERFGRVASQWKHDGSRVTDADLAISEALFAALRREFPGDDFFSEELAVGSGPIPRRSAWSWVLDPIDGTNNYALGVPLTAISLGLLRDGEPVYGFIYDFGRRQLYHGGPGRGMWLDGDRIAPRFGATGHAERIVATHTPLTPRYLPLVSAALQRFKLRAFGSGALHLTYASLGTIDACMDFTVKVWDIAAAAAFCRENGATMHFLSPGPFPLQEFNLKMKPMQYIGGSPAAVSEILELIRDVKFEPAG